MNKLIVPPRINYLLAKNGMQVVAETQVQGEPAYEIVSFDENGHKWHSVVTQTYLNANLHRLA
jgi:hypothetical protein